VQNPGVTTTARTGRTDVREAIEKGSQPHLSFGAGQGCAQAKMPAAGERQMSPGVIAFDVELVRVGENGRVTIGRGDLHHHQLALFDRPTGYLGVV
jgi:hypothetical protein